jgi:hypothetical protein
VKTVLSAVIGLFAVVAAVFGWRAVHTPVRTQSMSPSVQQSIAQPSGTQAQPPTPQTHPAPGPPSESAKHLGPFSIDGQNYQVELQTRKVQPGSTQESGDTVVAMEIKDAAGAIVYRRTFPYQETNDEFSDSWSVSALLLIGKNGSGLLVSYDSYSEPSAPEEEPTGWYQIFGVLDGKLSSFGAPIEVQGGLLDKYADGRSYKAERAFSTESDVIDFKFWSGHCRLIFPVRVDWSQGKLSPAQECAIVAGEPAAGCQYGVVPEDKLYRSDITFVRLWLNPSEKSAKPEKIVVKVDSKVELIAAIVPTRWVDGKSARAADNSNDWIKEAGGFGVAPDSDLWIKVRIDGREGWIHSEEDFRSLGLPEDE